MKPLYPCLIVLLLSTSAAAQSKVDSTYHARRIYISAPPYGLARIKNLINQKLVKLYNTGDKIPDDIYNSLTLRERFTYNALHLEIFSDNPGADRVSKGEDRKIFGELPQLFNGRDWSEDQKYFFMRDGDSVMKWIKEDAIKTNRIGLNYKLIIVNNHATQMLPFLVEFYKKERKDHDILTVMLLLMKYYNFSELVISSQYKHLFFSDSACVMANKTNEDLILQWAVNYNKGSSLESQDYHTYRMYISDPPYSHDKIHKIIANLKKGDEDEEVEPSDAVYKSLHLREKFTYHMIHAESYSQNCDIEWDPGIRDEDKKIFAHLPDLWENEGESIVEWSTRQREFFEKNKDSVIKLMKEDIIRTNRIGLNYKTVMVNIQATTMIPFLIDFYKKERKDRDILTVLMLFMENAQYPEFIASTSHSKLYDQYDVEGDGAYYSRFLVLNKANEDLIMQRAMNFYNGLRKK